MSLNFDCTTPNDMTREFQPTEGKNRKTNEKDWCTDCFLCCCFCAIIPHILRGTSVRPTSGYQPVSINGL